MRNLLGAYHIALSNWDYPSKKFWELLYGK